MALNGSGTFTRIYSWVADKAASVKITASRMDAEFDGIATALSSAMYKDGQQTWAANQSMGGYKLTSVGNATADSDALNRVTADERYLSKRAEVTVASASTTDVLGASSDRVYVTGTTAITSLGTGTNQIKLVRFADVLTLTHDGTSLICPGGNDITTAAGDKMIVVSDGSSNATVFAYIRASGDPDEVYVTLTGTQTLTNKTLTSPTVTNPTINSVSVTGTPWHSGNDGTGSGLDADTVDGVQASAFAQLSSNNTFTGSCSFTQNLNLAGAKVTSTFAAYQLIESDASADEKTWYLAANNGNFYIYAFSDNLASNTAAVTIARTGTTIDSVAFGASTLTAGGNTVIHAGNYTSYVTNVSPTASGSGWPVGSWLLAANKSGSSVSDGATLSGASLQTFAFNTTGGATLTGTWKNIHGASISNNFEGYFVRTA